MLCGRGFTQRIRRIGDKRTYAYSIVHFEIERQFPLMLKLGGAHKAERRRQYRPPLASYLVSTNTLQQPRPPESEPLV